MAIVAIFVVFPSGAGTQERPPHAIFMGKGFIGDRPVAHGATVEAWIQGEMVARTTTVGSEFSLFVKEAPGKFYHRDVVRFKLGGLETDAKAGWVDASESWIVLYAMPNPTGDGDVIVSQRELEARLAELRRKRSV